MKITWEKIFKDRRYFPNKQRDLYLQLNITQALKKKHLTISDNMDEVLKHHAK